MISSLWIENFALIDKVDIQFDKGFSVITGETGSGKSILLNALNLILGERADYSVIGELKDKSIVEASIDISNFKLTSFFKEHEIDFFDQCIIRREISKQGRSRAFVNDTPVQLSTLKQLSSQLFYIHSQYNTLELKDASYQLYVLDVLSGCIDLRNEFSIEYKETERLKKRLSVLESQLQEERSKSDYNSFQLSELEKINLSSIDYSQVQSKVRSIENADEIKTAFGTITSALGNELGVLDQLNSILNQLNRQSGIDDDLDALSVRLNSTLEELKDIQLESESRIESIEMNPEELGELTAQLDEYNRLLHKHRVLNQEELMSLMNELQSSEMNLDQLDEEVRGLQTQLKESNDKLIQRAEALHSLRVKSVEKIQRELHKELEELKMSDAHFEFKLNKADSLTELGCTRLEMLFQPNPGRSAVPIHKAASGGELSRVMLALQNLMSKKVQLQTIFFDEIDTGVSGDVAQKVGNTLKKMGETMQIIAITHLPQVAAKGKEHFKVMKSLQGGVMKSSIVKLSDTDRVEETARLMSGDVINDAALENAKALMSR